MAQQALLVIAPLIIYHKVTAIVACSMAFKIFYLQNKRHHHHLKNLLLPD